MYAIFACVKNKSRSVDPPCLDPLSYGRDGEPEPHLLLRRGRVATFRSRQGAETALADSLDAAEFIGAKTRKQFDYVILEVTQGRPYPGDGYRLLDEGEEIEVGDEVLDLIRGHWNLARYAGDCVGDHGDCLVYYRRKVVPYFPEGFECQPPASGVNEE